MKTHKRKTKNIPAVREETAGYGGSVVLYRAPDGAISLDVRLEKETIWLSLNQMARLFDRDKSFISRHLSSVFRCGELELIRVGPCY